MVPLTGGGWNARDAANALFLDERGTRRDRLIGSVGFRVSEYSVIVVGSFV